MTVGRRGASLLAYGAIFTLLGLYRLTQESLSPTAKDALTVALGVMPMPWWGGVMVAVGALACAAACLPAGRDGWGFLALSITGGWWFFVYAIGAAFYGEPSAWVSALQWGLVVVKVQIDAGWLEPRDTGEGP